MNHEPSAFGPEVHLRTTVKSRTREQAGSFRELAPSAIKASFAKLNPRSLARNPVMLVVEIGSVICSYYAIVSALDRGHDTGFLTTIAAWLWFTVLFANFAEAMAEGRGKAQADTLRKMKTETMANVVTDHETIVQISASQLKEGRRGARHGGGDHSGRRRGD